MNTLRIIAAVVIMLFAASICAMNWGCVIISMRNKKNGTDKHQSTVPLVSLILAMLVNLLYPFTQKWWIWIIPVIDIGNWMLVVGLPRAIAKGAFKKGPPGRIPEAAPKPGLPQD
ncbi:MAG: hypothetical protein A2283_06635 [Lentisphaerae bacterium RIFOXYA12_FULL_48_11]|nr:MAG: hypothetical protein A2283_06635 [Lentisphaerae bacterium RIFOXYA12_FULL_48_11]